MYVRDAARTKFPGSSFYLEVIPIEFDCILSTLIAAMPLFARFELVESTVSGEDLTSKY